MGCILHSSVSTLQKHVFDIGWSDGSPKDPIPVGFTVSPNASVMQTDSTRRWDWTGHDFDIVSSGGTTLLVSGDWHEGAVVYDMTDPTSPRSLDRYRTDDGAGSITPNDVLERFGDAPWAWNASYNPERGFVAVSDRFTGLYTFELSKTT